MSVRDVEKSIERMRVDKAKAEDRAAANYYANMKTKGKTVAPPQMAPTPVAAAAAPAKAGAAPAKAANGAKDASASGSVAACVRTRSPPLACASSAG